MPTEHENIQNDPAMFSGLPFNWAALTDMGKNRNKNEDTYIVEPEIGLFLISDGMGGHPAGEVASDFVSQNLSVRIDTELHSLRSQKPRTIRQMLKHSIRYHNREVWWEGKNQSGCDNMGAREDFRFDVGEPYRAKRFRSVINEVVLTQYALLRGRAVMVPIGMGISEKLISQSPPAKIAGNLQKSSPCFLPLP